MPLHTINPTPINGGTFASITHHSWNWCRLTDNKIFIIFQQTAPLTTFGQVVTFNGSGTPTYGTAFELNNLAASSPIFDCVVVEDGGAVGHKIMISMRLGTISAGSANSNDSSYNFQIVDIDVSDNMVAGAVQDKTSIGLLANSNTLYYSAKLASNQVGFVWLIGCTKTTGSYTDDTYLHKMQVVGTTISHVSNQSIETNTSNTYAGGLTFTKYPNGTLLYELNSGGASSNRSYGSGTIDTSGVVINNAGGAAGSGSVIEAGMSDDFSMSITQSLLRVYKTATTEDIATTFSSGVQPVDMLPISTDGTFMTICAAGENGLTGWADLTLQNVEVKVQRYLTGSSSLVPATPSAFVLSTQMYVGPSPSSTVWAGSDHRKYLHKISANNIAVIGLFNDGGTTKIGFQILTA